jgi:hypothetical protein
MLLGFALSATVPVFGDRADNVGDSFVNVVDVMDNSQYEVAVVQGAAIVEPEWRLALFSDSYENPQNEEIPGISTIISTKGRSPPKGNQGYGSGGISY